MLLHRCSRHGKRLLRKRSGPKPGSASERAGAGADSLSWGREGPHKQGIFPATAQTHRRFLSLENTSLGPSHSKLLPAGLSVFYEKLLEGATRHPSVC